MFELNGSDTNWLVYADYLEDQGIDATHIRELNPQINVWNYEFDEFDGWVGARYNNRTDVNGVGAGNRVDNGYIGDYVGDDTGVGGGIFYVGGQGYPW